MELVVSIRVFSSVVFMQDFFFRIIQFDQYAPSIAWLKFDHFPSGFRVIPRDALETCWKTSQVGFHRIVSLALVKYSRHASYNRLLSIPGIAIETINRKIDDRSSALNEYKGLIRILIGLIDVFGLNPDSPAVSLEFDRNTNRVNESRSASGHRSFRL